MCVHACVCVCACVRVCVCVVWGSRSVCRLPLQKKSAPGSSLLTPHPPPPSFIIHSHPQLLPLSQTYNVIQIHIHNIHKIDHSPVAGLSLTRVVSSSRPLFSPTSPLDSVRKTPAPREALFFANLQPEMSPATCESYTPPPKDLAALPVKVESSRLPVVDPRKMAPPKAAALNSKTESWMSPTTPCRYRAAPFSDLPYEKRLKPMSA